MAQATLTDHPPTSRDSRPRDREPTGAEPAPDDRPKNETGEHPEPEKPGEGDRKKEEKVDPKTKRRRLVIGVGVALVAVIAGGLIYWRGTYYEDTDDAQVDAYISNLSARVGGTVVAVHGEDNQVVKPGDVLVELDPVDLRVARDQAKAALAQATAQLRADRPLVPITEVSSRTTVSTNASDVATAAATTAENERAEALAEAQLERARSDHRLAQVEKARADELFRTGAISDAEHDRRTADADAAAANVNAMAENVEVAKRRIAEAQARANAAAQRLQEARANAPQQLEQRQADVEMRQAAVEAARAALEQAELNLDYTKVTTPMNGILGRRSVNVGDHVAPGQQLFALTQTDRMWVTANFRETQVRRMHPGQLVTVHVDALDRDFSGQIESLAGATGSRYSLLPPENATGNYVKVVQRLPVRISLDPNQGGLELLRPGMSVEPKVRVK